MADAGHNSAGACPVNTEHLRAFIERAERLHEERASLSTDIAQVYGEARANGFDVKVLKEIVKIRGQDRDKRIEHETILEVYMAALGLS